MGDFQNLCLNSNLRLQLVSIFLFRVHATSTPSSEPDADAKCRTAQEEGRTVTLPLLCLISSIRGSPTTFCNKNRLTPPPYLRVVNW